MGLLKSTDSSSSDIDYFDYRDDNYYGKYMYRARITIIGLRRVYFSENYEKFEARMLKSAKIKHIGKEEFDAIKSNLSSFKRYYEFQEANKKSKTVQIRNEANTSAIFSNDLQYLLTLKQIDPNAEFDITEVKTENLVGVKHFVNEPKHKFRVYLKSKKVPDDFKSGFRQFMKKNNKLRPSPGLNNWIKDNDKNQWSWWSRWLNSSHFIDYDDESTLSYLALMYGEYLGRRYKLEKRPEPV